MAGLSIPATRSANAACSAVRGAWVVGASGAIAGQLIGGLVSDLFGWRGIFLINVPVSVVAIAAALRRLPESRPPARTTPREPGLDLVGAATLVTALAALTYGLSRLAETGGDAGFAVSTAIAALLLVAFWALERRHPAPLVRFGLLANPLVRAGNPVQALSAGAVGGALFFTSLYLQLVLHYSPLAVGLAFAPVTLIVLLVSPVAGRLVDRVGVRSMLVAGMAFVGAGLLSLARAPEVGAFMPDVLPGLAAIAFGSGLAYAPSFVAGTSGVAESEQGLASGLLNTSQELGTAIGLALLGALSAAVATAAGADLTAGYRAGYLGALGLVALAIVAAASARPQAQPAVAGPAGDELQRRYADA